MSMEDALANALKFLKCASRETIDINVCPGMAPPPGMLPMDPNAFTLQPVLIAVSVIALVCLIPAVCVRTFTRSYLLKTTSWEDVSVILAFLGTAAFIGLMNKGFEYNCGKHMWNVSIADMMEVLRYANYTQLFYSPPVFFAKLAILMQISRIFSVGQRNGIFWSSWALIIANAVCYIIVMFLFIFECNPRQKIWNPSVEGKCMNTGNAVLAISAVNLASDVAILILPMFSVWNLQMPFRKKVGVVAIFSLGVLACACGIARIYYTVKIINTKDVTFYAAVVGLWSVAELTIVILCCCFPTFPRFIIFLQGKDRLSTNHSKYGNSARATPRIGYGTDRSKSSGRSAPKRSPWSMYDTNTTTLHGDDDLYIPLDERRIGLGSPLEKESTLSKSRSHEEWYGRDKELPSPPGNAIVRTTEWQTHSHSNRI